MTTAHRIKATIAVAGCAVGMLAPAATARPAIDPPLQAPVTLHPVGDRPADDPKPGSAVAGRIGDTPADFARIDAVPARPVVEDPTGGGISTVAWVLLLAAAGIAVALALRATTNVRMARHRHP